VLPLLRQFFEMFLVLGGLGHHDDLVKLRQRRHFLLCSDHKTPPLGMAHEAPHLRVVGVPHNDGGIALVRPAADNGLDPGHPDTGGVDDADPGGLQVFTLPGRNAVGPDHHESRCRDLPLLEDIDAPFL
jgi:hypothetical protein